MFRGRGKGGGVMHLCTVTLKYNKVHQIVVSGPESLDSLDTIYAIFLQNQNAQTS